MRSRGKNIGISKAQQRLLAFMERCGENSRIAFEGSFSGLYSIDLTGKTALITGVSNKRSIAWAIAQILHQAGARLAFTYRRERVKAKLEGLASELSGSLFLECDVQNDDQLRAVFTEIDSKFGRLDCLVHSVAFAPPAELGGLFVNTSRDGFKTALDISAYSLIPMAKHALPLMEKAGGGSLIGISYIAAERAVPAYNVMGTAKAALEQIIRQLAFELGPMNIRVNGISAGPIETVSARGVPGFTDFFSMYEQRAPLKRNVSQEEVAKSALYLLSDLGSGVTGEIIFVDSGFHIVGY